MNDAVDAAIDLGGGVRVGLVVAGTFRSDAGSLLGPVPWVLYRDLVADEIDADRRLTQALNCLLVETPAGRVLVETGIGERIPDKVRAMRGVDGDAILPALRRAGFDPATVDVVALSHLHFDHAGGLLDAEGRRAFPRAHGRRAASRVGGRARRQPAQRGRLRPARAALVRDWGDAGAADGEREVLPGVTVVPTGGHTGGHQGVVVRGPRGTVAFFGDLAMRPWSANPRWVTAFDDFPLDSVTVKASLFARAADEGWTVVLSHEPIRPIGRLVRDRDRFAWADGRARRATRPPDGRRRLRSGGCAGRWTRRRRPTGSAGATRAGPEERFDERVGGPRRPRAPARRRG